MDTVRRHLHRQMDILHRRLPGNIKHTILRLGPGPRQCRRNHRNSRDRTRERGDASLILDPNAWILDQARHPNMRIRGTWVGRCPLQP
jgi:hypothetical protein